MPVKLLAPVLLVVVLSPAATAADKAPVTIVVETVYPGANAQTVADTVAAPIEEQVKGVEGMRKMMSRSTHDGRYTLTITFKPGVDANLAQVLIQNRVSLTLPVLPDLVKRDGITVLKRAPGMLLFVTISSPAGRFDTIYLSNYTTVQIKDELARLTGVGDVRSFGARELSLRLWLDPDRLAARSLTAADVIDALRAQNLQLEAGLPAGKEKSFPIAVKSLGRLAEPAQLEEVIVKSGPGASVVRVKDLGRAELGAQQADCQVNLNGKPVVMLGMSLLPGAVPHEVSARAAQLVKKLRTHAPPDVDIAVAFDFTPNLEAAAKATTPGYLLLDVTLPASASAERTQQALLRCAELVRKVQGVQDVLTLTEQPFDLAEDQPCLLVRLAPADNGPAGRERLANAVRAQLQEVHEARIRLRDLSRPGAFPRCGYPIDFALRGPEPAQAREWAEKLAGRLAQQKQLTDVAAGRDLSPQPQLILEIDRTRAREMGVGLEDITTTLQTYLGSATVNDFNRIGRTWRVTVQVTPESRKQVEDIKQLKVRNGKGEMVPLGTLVAARLMDGPRAIARLDGEPMLEVTANPAAGTSLADARALCERLADELRKELSLPAGCRLTWLGDASSKD